MGKSSNNSDKFSLNSKIYQHHHQPPPPPSSNSKDGSRHHHHQAIVPPMVPMHHHPSLVSQKNNHNNNNNKAPKLNHLPHKGPKCGCHPNVESGKELSKKHLQRARRKVVYGILCFQLFVAAALIPLFSFHDGIKSFLRTQVGKGVAGGVALTGVGLLLLVLFCKGVRRKTPQNLIMLGALTLVFELMIGGISTIYDPYLMSMAAIVTAVIAIGLVGLAVQNKMEGLTVGQGVICCCLVVTFIFVGVFNFIPLPTELNLAKKVYACWGALTITMYFTGLLVALLPI